MVWEKTHYILFFRTEKLPEFGGLPGGVSGWPLRRGNGDTFLASKPCRSLSGKQAILLHGRLLHPASFVVTLEPEDVGDGNSIRTRKTVAVMIF